MTRNGKLNAKGAVWREDAAIWEIVAGELVAQRERPLAQAGRTALAERAGMLGIRAGELVRDKDLDAAGHALIGCSVTLGLAAISEEGDQGVSVEAFAAELAATVSWDAEQPSSDDLVLLTEEIAGAAEADHDGPTLWELAVRAGAGAAGLSQHITRRSQTRSHPQD